MDDKRKTKAQLIEELEEAGKLTLEPYPVNLREIFSKLKMIFEQRTLEKRPKLEFEADENIPKELLLDEIRVRQVMVNLVDNAMKFTKHGTVTVRARCSPLSGKSDLWKVTIEVEDTGIGIPKDQQEHIFQAFTQVEGLDQRLYEGAGLGLAISKRLIEMMGGSISVRSTLGEGSVFTIRLPEVKTVASLELAKTGEGVTIEMDTIAFTPATVLLVEDDPFFQKLVRHFLSKTALTLMVANNGQEGLEAAASHKPDLILMDIRMPVMDGHQAIVHLRRDETLKDIPIIALTAGILQEDEIDAISAGADSFLRKPVTQEKLIAILCRFLPYEIKRETPSRRNRM